MCLSVGTGSTLERDQGYSKCGRWRALDELDWFGNNSQPPNYLLRMAAERKVETLLSFSGGFEGLWCDNKITNALETASALWGAAHTEPRGRWKGLI